ncbi:MAG: hypothetical protein V1644_01805 [Candidatus Micrarchaeota archaeon]
MKIFPAIVLLSFSLLLVGCIFFEDDYYDEPIPQEVIDAANRVPKSPFPTINVTPNRTIATTRVQNNSATLQQNTTAQNTSASTTAVQNTTSQPAPQLSAPRLQVTQIDYTNVDFQNLQQTSPSLSITVVQSEYAVLLDDPRISSAIGVLTESERGFLLASANELETGNTATWAEYDSGNGGSYVLTKSEARKVWLRRVAQSLYVELHREVPWSLRDYGASDLSYLLSFCTEDYEELFQSNYAGFVHYPCQQFFKKPNPNYENYEMLLIWEPNPLTTTQIAKNLLTDFKPANQNALVDGIVLRMRQIGWNHIGSDADEQFLTNGIPGFVTTMDRLYSLKRGGSGFNSVFMAAILRYYNVPAKVGEANGHGDVQFPTVNKAMFSGDWVHGWPKGLPIENSYLTNDQIQYYFSLPVCTSQVEVDKVKLRRMLSIYNNDALNERVYYGPDGFCYLGDEYVTTLLSHSKSTDSECIDGSNPNKGKWTTPFGQSEIDQWTSNLQNYANQSRICT